MSKVKGKTKSPNYTPVSVHPDTFGELVKMKTERERGLGISLSWNDFFLLWIKEQKATEAKA